MGDRVEPHYNDFLAGALECFPSPAITGYATDADDRGLCERCFVVGQRLALAFVNIHRRSTLIPLVALQLVKADWYWKLYLQSLY